MNPPTGFSTVFDGGTRRSRLAAACFGDRVGLAAFLAALCLFSAFWILDWRINDTLTLMNALHGMSQGQLHMAGAEFGPSMDTPGAHRVGDRMYGRNYGVLAISLVPFAAIEAISLVADLRIALVGAFSFGVLALALTVGRIVDRHRDAAIVGGVVATTLFVGNVALATDVDPTRTELYALQVTHVIAAAVVVVLGYRLLAAMHGRRAGLFAAALVALATPIGLWATVPKRHVFSAALALGLAFALYRSRTIAATDEASGLRYRVAAYAAIGLFAWIHAPEALLVLVVFAAVDIPTARNTLRSFGAIAVALAVSTIPFLVTNYLISGSPVTPPRMLQRAGSGTGEPSFSGGGGGGGGTGLLAPVIEPFDPVLGPFFTLASIMGESLDNLVARPGDVFTIFVRSGYLGGWSGDQAGYESVNLAILESAPILAATIGAVPAAIAILRRRANRRLDWPPSPERVVDAFLAVFAVAFGLLYASRLPIHAQITVRYLLPIFPVLVVSIVRLRTVRGVLADHWRLLLWSYAAAVLIGGQLVVLVLALVNPGAGEAFQFHAWPGLAIAVPLAGWSVVGRHDGWWGRIGAVLIALATAASTVFLLMLTLEYFTVGNSQALPLVRAIAEIVSIG